MKILGVECTASPVSCALLEDGKIIGEYFLNQKITHSQTLLPMIESLLKLSCVSLDDIDAIAITAGPGSFTGVRIGISAVKGLATPNNKPCIPVSVLESMAYNLLGQNCIVCAVMDARCNQVYNALFDVCDRKILRLCDDRAIMIDELVNDFNKLNFDKSIFLVGDGANLVYNSLKDKVANLKLAPENFVYQKASSVCMCSVDALNCGKTVYAEKLLPFYLRLPQAERELRAKQNIKRGNENG